MNKKLELLALAKNFKVTVEDDIYKIESKESDLEARIKDNEVDYYICGCYNSGTDLKKIDIDDFSKLVKFCKCMIEGE